MRFTYIMLLVICFCNHSKAQSANTTIISDYGSEIFINHKKLSSKSNETTGSQYLNNIWLNGRAVTFSDEEISSYPLMYDLGNKVLEIKLPNDIKVLPATNIKYFELFESKGKKTFYNSRNFKSGSITDIFLEQLLKGTKINLYKSTELVIQKAQYVAALDAGNPSDRFVKKRNLYYTKDNTLYKLGKTKKEILPIFGDNSLIIKEYANKSKLNLKNENHFLKIVEYYNSL